MQHESMVDGDRAERREEARDLLNTLVTLRQCIKDSAATTFASWHPTITRPDFKESAENLAHYLALRSHDLRALQRRLTALGFSSLGRLEARVMANLDAVATLMTALADQEELVGCYAPTTEEFFRGEHLLSENVQAVFGPQSSGRSHILVTLDRVAAEDPNHVYQLVKQGADCVRINCAHDDLAVWQHIVKNVRKAERRTGRKIRILIDIAGPKVRLGRVDPDSLGKRLHVGDELLLCPNLPEAGVASTPIATCEPEAVLNRVRVGDPVSLDDGKLWGRVVREDEAGLIVQFDRGRQKGLKLKPDRGINFPGVPLHLDPLSAKDITDLEFVCAHADMVGFSFVETKEHVAQLQQQFASRRPGWRGLALVAKIETPLAVRNLPDIIVQAAGQQPLAVMIARGDLAVEIGFTRLAEMQEEIMWICEAAHIPVIWATQVLEGLVKEGLPSRGEMTDAAMAGRAECVMLNKGPNVLEAVGVLDSLLRRMTEHQLKKTSKLRALHAWSDNGSDDGPSAV